MAGRAAPPADERKAALSAWGGVAFRNETYLDARLGATVAGLTAEIRYVGVTKPGRRGACPGG